MQLSEHIIQLEAELEKEPSDQQARSILADAYESIGDPLAETLRWMVAEDRRPWINRSVRNKPVSWTTVVGVKSTISEAVFNLMKGGRWSRFTRQFTSYYSVKDATQDLHEALTGGKDSE